MTETVWDMAGMSRSAYLKLPWLEKAKLLRRFKGMGIGVACAGCGLPLSVAREQQALAALPKRMREHPYGLLIASYQKDVAEKESIKRQFPGAAF